MPRSASYVEVTVDGTKYLVPQGLVNLLLKQALPAGVPAEKAKLYRSLLNGTGGDAKAAMDLLKQVMAREREREKKSK